jgi:hypothetical protein
MGLDQYAYVSAKANARDEYYSDENYDKDDADPTKIGEPREIAYWRKHPNLHGWFERLWHRKQPDAAEQTSFNGIELELTWDDIEDLERAVIHQQLPSTQGFFFGDNSDDYYREQDLAFVKNAKAELFMGLKVFYNSSW